MRASLDWSNALLSEEERQLFARLSIFSGSFDLSAAAAVCPADPISAGEMLDQIQGLVDQSLVTVEPVACGTRDGISALSVNTHACVRWLQAKTPRWPTATVGISDSWQSAETESYGPSTLWPAQTR